MFGTITMMVMTFFIKCVRMFVESLGIIIFGIINRNYKLEKLPPITNKLLLESASSLAWNIRNGEITSEEITTVYIERIKIISPLINAVVDTRFDDAIKESKVADKFLRANANLVFWLLKEKPLFGVPITIKENFKVKGLHQTVGIYSRKDIISTDDAQCVKLLKQAGAIIMAVTNVPEICMWWETYNTIYGRTVNPYNFSRIVGGSSGGEAANLCGCGSPLGLGSDIGGSIRMPAYFNGIFGHKPSTGMVDNSGQEPPISEGMEKYLSSGPLCRYACDLKLMCKVLASSKHDKLNLEKEVNLRNLKIYYMVDDNGNPYTTPVDKELKDIITKTATYFNATYGVQCEELKLTQFRRSCDMFFTKICGDPQRNTFCEQLADGKGEINVWLECVKWVFSMSHHTYPALMFGIMEKFANWHKKSSMYTLAMKDFEDLKEFFTEKLNENEIFLFPPSPNEAPYHNQPLFRWFNPIYTAIFNILELPVTTCPMGLNSNGLPLGIQVVAGKYQDRLCLSVAEELEKAFGGWVCPSEI